jgi:hypothetical protein
MSGAVYDFTCTRCDFKGSYSSGRGAFVYRTRDGSAAAAPWGTAWCASCGTIRRIQTGLSVATLEAEYQRLERMPRPKGSLPLGCFGVRTRLQVVIVTAYGRNSSCLRCSGGATRATLVWSAEAQMCSACIGDELTKLRGP